LLSNAIACLVIIIVNYGQFLGGQFLGGDRIWC